MSAKPEADVRTPGEIRAPLQSYVRLIMSGSDVPRKISGLVAFWLVYVLPSALTSGVRWVTRIPSEGQGNHGGYQGPEKSVYDIVARPRFPSVSLRFLIKNPLRLGLELAAFFGCELFLPALVSTDCVGELVCVEGAAGGGS